MSVVKNFTIILILVFLLILIPVGTILGNEKPNGSDREKPLFHSGFGYLPQVSVTANPPKPSPPANPWYYFYSQASYITSDAILTVMKYLRPKWDREIDIEYRIGSVYESYGLSKEPCWYPDEGTHDVAAGMYTQYDHHKATSKNCWPGELVRVDTGAGFWYAMSDVTRTFPVSYYFTSRQKAIYAAVLEALKAGEKRALGPNPTYGEIVAAMINFFYQYVRDKNLQALDGTTYYYLDHFIHTEQWHHFIGQDKDIHGDHVSWTNDQPLEPGMVFALEPAVYIPSESMGIRIEDTYMVNPAGVLIRLSATCPREVAEIEALRQSRRR